MAHHPSDLMASFGLRVPQIRIHKTKQLSAMLPASLRSMRLVFLVPKQFSVRTLTARITKMLQLEHTPTLRLFEPERLFGQSPLGARPRDEDALRARPRDDDALRGDATLGSYYEAHGDLSDGFLHISIDVSASM
jgi:hypothetical protein